MDERLGKSKTTTKVVVFSICSLSLWERAGVRASGRTLCITIKKPGGASAYPTYGTGVVVGQVRRSRHPTKIRPQPPDSPAINNNPPFCEPPSRGSLATRSSKQYLLAAPAKSGARVGPLLSSSVIKLFLSRSQLHFNGGLDGGAARRAGI